MKVIYKYSIRTPQVTIQKNAQIVKVGLDYNDEPCIWAIVDPNEENEKRNFIIVGTGESWSNDLGDFKYIGTYFDGGYVWHVLEVKL